MGSFLDRSNWKALVNGELILRVRSTTEKIGVEVFRDFGNLVLEEKGEDTIIRESN